MPGALPWTHHRTVVPWEEEPALLVAWHSESQLKSSGARGCFASGSRRCGAGRCHPSRSDLLQVQVDLSASPTGKSATVGLHM